MSQQHASCPKEPALLRVNHQLRRESLPIFYGTTTFSFVTLNNAKGWLEILPTGRLEMLGSVHASSGRHESFEAYWSNNRGQATKDLLEGWQSCQPKGIREGVVTLPMRVEDEVGDEWGLCWFGFREIDEYAQRYKGFVRRRFVVRS